MEIIRMRTTTEWMHESKQLAAKAASKMTDIFKHLSNKIFYKKLKSYINRFCHPAFNSYNINKMGILKYDMNE